MSNKVSVLVYSRRFGSPVRKAVMVYFAERSSDNGEGIWAAKRTIAQAIECGRSTVIRTINEFVSEGLLVEVGKRACRNGSTTEYAINLEAVAALIQVNDVPERDGSQSGTGPRAGHDPSQSGTPTRPAAGPKPPLRTTIEPVCGDADTHTHFSDFFSVHPKPRNHEQTLKAFEAAIEAGAGARAIVEAAEAYAAEQEGNNAQFVKSSDRWLASKGWEDFAPAARPDPAARNDLIQKMLASHIPSVREQGLKMQQKEDAA